MDDVADIDEAEPDTTADRRGDAGIRELERGVVDMALIRRDGTIKLANQCGLRVELLLGNDGFLKKKLESFEIHFGVSALSLIFGQLSQGLCKLDLEGTGIDLCEKISFVDELAFLKRNAGELPIHATANRDGVEGGDSANAIEIDGQVPTLGGGDDHRHTQVACAETSFALVFCSCRGGIYSPAGVSS